MRLLSRNFSSADVGPASTFTIAADINNIVAALTLEPCMKDGAERSAAFSKRDDTAQVAVGPVSKFTIR